MKTTFSYLLLLVVLDACGEVNRPVISLKDSSLLAAKQRIELSQLVKVITKENK